MFRWVLCALPWGLPGCQPPPFWGITHPCNREAFGAEIYPSLKVSNIWRKLFCKIMQVQISHLSPVPETLASSCLHVTTRSPPMKWQMSQCVMHLSCVDSKPRYSSQCIPSVLWIFHTSFQQLNSQNNCSVPSVIFSVDLAQDPRVKQQLDGSRNIINNPENPFITATACWFCGLTAQAKKDINTILCND